MRDNVKKRISIDPKTLKKHSSIVKANSGGGILVTGPKTKTDTGYTIAGFSNKNLETYFELMVGGSSSPVLRHPTKDRVIRVCSGSGLVVVQDGKLTKEHKVTAGDEVVFGKNSLYRISTYPGYEIEFFVVQDSDYASKLEVVDASTKVGVDLSPAFLEELTEDQKTSSQSISISNRVGSKASQQLANERAGKRLSPQVARTVTTDTAIPESATTVAGVNARPSGGNFDESGAG